MISQRLRKPEMNDLQSIAEHLEADYYSDIEFICSNALIYISQVMEMDVHGAMALNAVLCEQLINQVMDTIRAKRTNSLGYFIQLAEKQQGGHDCSACSGNCNMEHGMQLMKLKESNKNIESIIYRLQTEGTPLRDIEYPPMYAAVRQQMANLEKKLVELSIFEQSRLIPGILNAQQQINVHA